MLKNIINKLFNKGEEDEHILLPKDTNAQFVLMIDNFIIGYLKCENGLWIFSYSEKFKVSDEYNTIPGFPNVKKTYENESLWPFFKIRIPGLNQPAVKETLEKENIDKSNEFELLKRFGYKTISNPYELRLLL